MSGFSESGETIIGHKEEALRQIKNNSEEEYEKVLRVSPFPHPAAAAPPASPVVYHYRVLERTEEEGTHWSSPDQEQQRERGGGVRAGPEAESSSSCACNS